MPRVPIETEYIWDWFQDLHGHRRAGFNVDALNWTEILAYFILLDLRPQRWELEAIARLDTAYISSRIDKAQARAADAKSMGRFITGKAEK